MRRNRRVVGFALVLASVGIVGCGKTADQLAADRQRAANQVGFNNGTMIVDDGHGHSYTVGQNGVDVSTPDGAGPSDISAKLPAGWPGDLTPPPSITIVYGVTDTNGGKTTMSTDGTTPAAPKEVYAAAKKQLIHAGYILVSDAFSTTLGYGQGILHARNSKWDVRVTVTKDPVSPSGPTAVSISIRTAG